MSKILGIDGSPLTAEKTENGGVDTSFELSESIRKANERKAEVEQLVDEAYVAARENFLKDESYFKDYEDFVPEGKRVLVKLFEFSVPEELRKEIDLGKTDILVQSPLNGELKPKYVSYYEKIYPIVKIIAVGDEIVGTDKGAPKYKKGDTAAVQVNEIEGKVFNPVFLQILNTFGKSGNGKPSLAHVPEDVPQKVPALDVNWDRFKFTNLSKPTDTSEKLVYLIPDVKLLGHIRR